MCVCVCVYLLLKNIGMKMVYKIPKHVAVLGCWWLYAIFVYGRNKTFYLDYLEIQRDAFHWNNSHIHLFNERSGPFVGV